MLKKKNSNLSAGIDDATKCPCIGSIFIAGVAANKATIKKWKDAGVKDSKLIAPKKRQKLAQLIKETAAIYTIDEVYPSMIDDKRLNLNAWEMAIVLQIMTRLQQTKPENTIITQAHIDNWEVNTNLFWQRLQDIVRYNFATIDYPEITIDYKAFEQVTLIPEHRADENYTVVGAASILAKTASEEQYEHYKELYGNFGSGSPADPATRLFVWQHRKNPPACIRQSWNTFKTLAPLDDITQDPHYKRPKKNKPALVL